MKPELSEHHGRVILFTAWTIVVAFLIFELGRYEMSWQYRELHWLKRDWLRLMN